MYRLTFLPAIYLKSKWHLLHVKNIWRCLTHWHQITGTRIAKAKLAVRANAGQGAQVQ